MKIISAIVLTGRGPDKVMLKTDLPCQYVPAFLPSQPPLELDFHATAGTGVEYVRENFGLEPEIIEM
jgi:hypothetical protein